MHRHVNGPPASRRIVFIASIDVNHVSINACTYAAQHALLSTAFIITPSGGKVNRRVIMEFFFSTPLAVLVAYRQN